MKTFMDMYLECVAGDVIGPADSGATQFSDDTYAPNDSRVPSMLFGGVLTRGGAIRPIKRRKSHKKKARK